MVKGTPPPKVERSAFIYFQIAIGVHPRFNVRKKIFSLNIQYFPLNFGIIPAKFAN